ncbi:MAG: acyltransferase [Bacteroidota bacterium]
MYQDIKYFKGLNGLRFFAAYLVLMHHAEQIRLKYDLFSLKAFSLFNNGGLAVSFFFVLSGYLITYLLLREVNRTQDVAVRKFYVRRILRIWPLYYLLVVLGTLVVPLALQIINNPYEMPYTFGEVIAYYVLFAPFMVNILFGHHLLEPLWSIGVEEIYYILWAPLVRFFKKNILPLILGVIVLRLIILHLIPFLNLPEFIVEAIYMLKFEAMAIGGLFAYGVFHRKTAIEESRWFSTPVQIGILLFILARVFAKQSLIDWSPVFEFLFALPILSNLLILLAFAWLIVNVSINTKSLVKLDYPIFQFLGDISYGIYMYHMLVIFSIVLVGKEVFNSFDPSLGTLVFYLLISAAVILVATLSKRLFEDRFLALKTKFR